MLLLDAELSIGNILCTVVIVEGRVIYSLVTSVAVMAYL